VLPWQICADGHAWLQVPQLALSVIVLVQALPQSVGVADGQLHVPLTQLWADGHAWEHVLQLALSVIVLVQALPQSVGVPLGQVQTLL
jgi:hypothetical protein